MKPLEETEFWELVMRDVFGPREGGVIIVIDAENARKGVAKTSAAASMMSARVATDDVATMPNTFGEAVVGASAAIVIASNDADVADADDVIAASMAAAASTEVVVAIAAACRSAPSSADAVSADT